MTGYLGALLLFLALVILGLHAALAPMLSLFAGGAA
jgi:hypothetical protein